MIAVMSPHALKVIIGVVVGVMGWALLLWNPKSKRQWFWASLMFGGVILYLIFGH